MALALFDFDGTITTHETMPDFLRRSISPRRLLVEWLLLAPLVLGYKLRVVSGTLVRRAIVRFGYSGVPVSVVAAFGREFAKNYLPNVLRPEAMQRIAWHKDIRLLWFQAASTHTSSLGAMRRGWSFSAHPCSTRMAS